MGFEWMQDTALAVFPDKKLTVKVPPRKPVPLEISAPMEEDQSEGGAFVPKLSLLLGLQDGPRSPEESILCEVTGNIREHYVLGRELGRGHFGVVRQCENRKTLELVACKSINKENLKKKEEIKELQAEIGVMERLGGHANVVQLKDVFEDSEAVHLVMELCKEGDLFDYIARKRRLPEPEAAKIFRQVVLAVQYCHSRGVIHRDLKPENILFSKVPHDGHGELQVKLADFGLAVVVKPGEMASGLAGSPFYMAPELVKRRPYDEEIDVWSLGVILYTALSGFLPFWGKTHEQTFAAVCRGEADFFKKPWQVISPEAKSLVRKMLTMDPKRRATIDDILTHPWILAHCPKSAPRSRPKPFVHQQQASVFSFTQPPVPWSPREYADHHHPVPQALSAPKGQFSPPRTPSPQASPRAMPPKPSFSQLMPTPPGTPKKDGEHNHVTPFAAALTKPFRFLQQSREPNHQGKGKEEPSMNPHPPVSPAQTTPRPFFLSEPHQKFPSKRELILEKPLQGNRGQSTLTEERAECVIPGNVEEVKGLSEASSSGGLQGGKGSPQSTLESIPEAPRMTVAGHLTNQLRKMVC